MNPTRPDRYDPDDDGPHAPGHLARLGRHLLPYLAVVGTGMVINLVLVAAAGAWLGAVSGAPYFLSAFVARLLANVWGFIMNERFTFAATADEGSEGKRLRFLWVNLLSVASMGVYLGVAWVGLRLGLHYLVATAVGIGVAFVVNYTFHVFWLYGRRTARRQHG